LGMSPQQFCDKNIFTIDADERELDILVMEPESHTILLSNTGLDSMWKMLLACWLNAMSRLV
jgi:hypothetical protein